MKNRVPHFFFHYHTPGETSRDDMGCSFESLDLAYLDAYRSMIEIGADLLKGQTNPAGHWIEVTDSDGAALMELHFDEIFRRRDRMPALGAQSQILRARLARFKQLRDEMNVMCADARASVARAHEMLRRARSMS